MPSLRELANNVSNFEYYSGRGNFTQNKLGFGNNILLLDPSGPSITFRPNFRWSPSNFDEGLFQFGAVSRATRTAADLLRIGAFLSSARGGMFLIEQKGLQKTNPKIEFLGEDGKNRRGSEVFGPTREYSFLPLLAQIGANGREGIMYTRHGKRPEISNPFSYESYILSKDEPKSLYERRNSINKDNRLVYLATNVFNPQSEEFKNNYLLRYRGGPDSFYGIGETIIRRYSDKIRDKDRIFPTYYDPVFYTGSYQSSSLQIDRESGGSSSSKYLLFTSSISYSKQILSLKSNSSTVLESSEYIKSVDSNWINTTYKKFPAQINVTSDEDFQRIDVGRLLSINDQLNEINIDSNGKQKFFLSEKADFRKYKNIVSQNLNNGKKVAESDYSSDNLEDRIGIAVARKSERKINYSESETDSLANKEYDSLNALSLYYNDSFYKEGLSDFNNIKIGNSNKYNSSVSIKDSIKFRIKAIDNDSPKNGIYIIFRAYIDSVKRSVESKWSDYNYTGRGESFYLYNGFKESISISFKIAASSRVEMKPLYQKLNYLISTLAPDYKSSNFMRGTFSELTIGNFLYKQPGIITNLDITIDEDSPWEIAIDDEKDSDMHELPQILKCSMTFIPIYNFLPKKSPYVPFIGIDSKEETNQARKWLTGESINKSIK